MSTTKAVTRSDRGGFKRITWATNASVSGDMFRQNSPTVSHYREWVDCGGYSAVLFDGSILQMSYDFNYTELVGHRLLYFPCPFDLDPEILRTFTLMEVIDLYRENEDTNVKLRTPLRFDYDLGAIGSGHPASHVTFQWAHTRIPVMSPISIGHFVQFVFKNFYPDIWMIHSFIREWPRREVERTITLEDKNVLHLDSLT